MSSNCDLQHVFDVLRDKLPTNDDDSIVLSGTNLPQLPERMECSGMLIKRGQHTYSGYGVVRRDFLVFEADKSTYRFLALALLAKIFHEKPVLAHILLTNPASDIREVVLDYEQELHGLSFAHGYKTRPHQYEYRRSHPARAYSWFDIPQGALPAFALATQRGDPIDDTDWGKRDVLRCAGSDHGHVRLAGMLLDFGHPNEQCNKIMLEGELGNKGIDPFSPEVQFLLPGGFGWSGELSLAAPPSPNSTNQ
jgi:hypothetical protein